jgi:hypothetical protein
MRQLSTVRLFLLGKIIQKLFKFLCNCNLYFHFSSIQNGMSIALVFLLPLSDRRKDNNSRKKVPKILSQCGYDSSFSLKMLSPLYWKPRAVVPFVLPAACFRLKKRKEARRFQDSALARARARQRVSDGDDDVVLAPKYHRRRVAGKWSASRRPPPAVSVVAGPLSVQGAGVSSAMRRNLRIIPQDIRT